MNRRLNPLLKSLLAVLTVGLSIVMAIYSSKENLDFVTAYMTAQSGGDVLVGTATCVFSADTTMSTITLE